MRWPTWSVRARFVGVLVVVAPALVAVAWTSLSGLQTMRSTVDVLFNDIIATSHATSDMVASTDDVHAVALAQLAADPARARVLQARLLDDLVPTADAKLAAVVRLHADDGPRELATIHRLSDRWHTVRSLLNGFAVSPPTAAIGGPRVDAAFASFDQIARGLVRREVADGRAAYENALRPARTSRRNTLAAMGGGLLAACLAIAWLFRSVLPRTRAVTAYAGRLADGHFDEQLEVVGDDELARLGQTLDQMAERRQRELGYDSTQLEFTENLQLAEDEVEAHHLLRRHLERSIPGTAVVILNRNNSQDRLEAVTDVDPASPLVQSLVGAAPRSCLAVRRARTHERSDGDDSLLDCPVCSGCDGHVSCTPFLVGGEVIGSVLLNGAEAPDAEEARRVRESVVQAAPVLANLRNLAIAETRAATDALTGLPNRRAIDATILRMVAHAGRSVSPMAVVLFDLDHFKQINDRYGHGGGDEVLAAVGAAVRATIRDGDFAGRYGGEEFLVALPDTDVGGGLIVAEKLRRAVSEIFIASVGQTVTTSLGVAALPEHATDATALVRAADRALYLAKNNGRDRAEAARAGDGASRPDESVTTAAG